MVFGRFLPIVLVLAGKCSGSSGAHTGLGIGTLPTHRPQFVGWPPATLILVALTDGTDLALGPSPKESTDMTTTAVESVRDP